MVLAMTMMAGMAGAQNRTVANVVIENFNTAFIQTLQSLGLPVSSQTEPHVLVFVPDPKDPNVYAYLITGNYTDAAGEHKIISVCPRLVPNIYADTPCVLRINADSLSMMAVQNLAPREPIHN